VLFFFFCAQIPFFSPLRKFLNLVLVLSSRSYVTKFLSADPPVPQFPFSYSSLPRSCFGSARSFIPVHSTYSSSAFLLTVARSCAVFFLFSAVGRNLQASLEGVLFPARRKIFFGQLCLRNFPSPPPTADAATQDVDQQNAQGCFPSLFLLPSAISLEPAFRERIEASSRRLACAFPCHDGFSWGCVFFFPRKSSFLSFFPFRTSALLVRWSRLPLPFQNFFASDSIPPPAAIPVQMSLRHFRSFLRAARRFFGVA